MNLPGAFVHRNLDANGLVVTMIRFVHFDLIQLTVRNADYTASASVNSREATATQKQRDSQSVKHDFVGPAASCSGTLFKSSREPFKCSSRLVLLW